MTEKTSIREVLGIWGHEGYEVEVKVEADEIVCNSSCPFCGEKIKTKRVVFTVEELQKLLTIAMEWGRQKITKIKVEVEDK